MKKRREKRGTRQIGGILVALICCLLLGIGLGSCGTNSGTKPVVQQRIEDAPEASTSLQEFEEPDAQAESAEAEPQVETEPEEEPVSAARASETTFTPEMIPAYAGESAVEINGGVPFFTEEDLAFTGESYSDLDALGRCGVCMARVEPETLPTEPRGQIGEVRPSGWHIAKYQGIDGHYLYNRSHLIGWQLTAENANPNNLITGTRHMNAEVMEPIETRVGNYVRDTGHHVLYRATPVFEGADLVATGVLLEAQSLEDERVRINMFCYNVQPGITIDYATGDSSGPAYQEPEQQERPDEGGQSQPAGGTAQTRGIPGLGSDKEIDDSVTYVGNANSKKFHLKDCSSVRDMAEHNMVLFYGDRQDVIDAGYEPCGRCHP